MIEPLVALVDGWPDDTHRTKTRLGGEPIEDGRDVSDHAVALEEEVILEGWVSDFQGRHRPEDAWQAVRDLVKQTSIVEVISELGHYEEMIIRMAEAERIGRGARFRMELQEILRVEVDPSPFGVVAPMNRGRVNMSNAISGSAYNAVYGGDIPSSARVADLQIVLNVLKRMDAQRELPGSANRAYSFLQQIAILNASGISDDTLVSMTTRLLSVRSFFIARRDDAASTFSAGDAFAAGIGTNFRTSGGDAVATRISANRPITVAAIAAGIAAANRLLRGSDQASPILTTDPDVPDRPDTLSMSNAILTSISNRTLGVTTVHPRFRQRQTDNLGTILGPRYDFGPDAGLRQSLNPDLNTLGVSFARR